MEINFNNYGGEELGTFGKGINIYNQRYTKEETLNNELSKEQIINILKKVVKGNFISKELLTSNPFSIFDYVSQEQNQNSLNYLLHPNFIAVFECNCNNSYSYYCYFKDNSSNVWLIYIPLKGEDKFPIIFDLQDNLEPTFYGIEEGEGENKNLIIKSCETANFKIQSKDNVFEYTVQLKNTSFNIPVNETKEYPAIIKPIYGFKLEN